MKRLRVVILLMIASGNLCVDDKNKEAACEELAKHKEYWKDLIDLDPAKKTRLQLVCDPCQALIEHEAYWQEHGGVDLDPAKRELLKGFCDPCKALTEHDAYWKSRGGIDFDPAKRIILNELCYPGSIDRSFTNVVNQTVEFGDTTLKVVKKYSLDVIHAISAPLREKIKSDFYLRENDPHKSNVAHVRMSNDPVCPQERAHRAERFTIVKAAQEKFLGMELADDEVLDISFSLSGGGVRASLCGLGSLVGAQKIGLLDCVMTINALSGGTWVLFPWIASNKDIESYRDNLISKWNKGFPVPSANEIKYIVDDALLMPFAFEKDVTPTDIYGAALNNVLFSEFGPKRQRVKLSDLAGRTQYPVPVGEAAWAGLTHEEIFECTPYEFGSRWLQAYIPAWGFGRKYYNGVSINSAPENAIPLGTFGSAYAVRASVINKEILGSAPSYIKAPLDKLMSTKVGEIHSLFSITNNYTRGITSSPIKDEHDIPLSDAGAGYFLQIQPISGAYRGTVDHIHPDVIFLFDAGAGAPYEDLKKMDAFLTHLNLPHPHVLGDNVGKDFYTIATVYEDYTAENNVDISKPVFMYYPRVSDKKLLDDSKKLSDFDRYKKILQNFDMQECLDTGDCGTFSFSWPRERAEQVATLTEFNIVASANLIKEKLRSLVQAKRDEKKI